MVCYTKERTENTVLGKILGPKKEEPTRGSENFRMRSFIKYY
jgi:hypothetical protein